MLCTLPDTNSIFLIFFVKSVSVYHKKFRGMNSRFLKHKVLVYRSKNSILKNFSVICTGPLYFKNLLYKPRRIFVVSYTPRTKNLKNLLFITGT